MFGLYRNTRRFYSSMNKLIVSPSISHVCSKVDITGIGFEPNIPLTIQGKLVCPEEGFDFQSYAHIYTNDEGYFDLKTTESIGGTYKGVDQMGLFWSMVTQIKHSSDRANFGDGLRKIFYDFNVYFNHIDKFSSVNNLLISSGQCSRYLAKNVVKMPVEHNKLRGTLYFPERKESCPRPAILVLKGGLKRKGALQEEQATMLANEGFITFNLGFFGVADLSAELNHSPIMIEYFEEAIEFLRSLDEVASDEIYVFGHSQAGDIVLALMAHLPQIKKVCCVNGNVASSSSPMIYKGIKTKPLIGDSSKINIVDAKTIDVFDYLNNPLDVPENIHNFHTSNADLLMIAGLKDRCFRTKLMVDIAKDRMDSYGKTNYNILEYPDMAHFLDAPFMPVCVYEAIPLIPKEIRIFYGGEDKMTNSQQQFVAWQSVVNFFKN